LHGPVEQPGNYGTPILPTGCGYGDPPPAFPARGWHVINHASHTKAIGLISPCDNPTCKPLALGRECALRALECNGTGQQDLNLLIIRWRTLSGTWLAQQQRLLRCRNRGSKLGHIMEPSESIVLFLRPILYPFTLVPPSRILAHAPLPSYSAPSHPHNVFSTVFSRPPARARQRFPLSGMGPECALRQFL
jgi:hypothetical protein